MCQLWRRSKVLASDAAIVHTYTDIEKTTSCLPLALGGRSIIPFCGRKMASAMAVKQHGRSCAALHSIPEEPLGAARVWSIAC